MIWRALAATILCLAIVTPAANASAQGPSAVLSPVDTIVDALASETSISAGIATGLGQSLAAQPIVGNIEARHPGFRATVEHTVLDASREALHEQYPILRAQLKAVVIETLSPDDRSRVAAYLAGPAGTRLILSWTGDSETDLLRYWPTYISSYDQDVTERIRKEDAALAASGDVGKLAKLNSDFSTASIVWQSRLQASVKERLPAILQAIVTRLGLCSEIPCRRRQSPRDAQ